MGPPATRSSDAPVAGGRGGGGAGEMRPGAVAAQNRHGAAPGAGGDGRGEVGQRVAAGVDGRRHKGKEGRA